MYQCINIFVQYHVNTQQCILLQRMGNQNSKSILHLKYFIIVSNKFVQYPSLPRALKANFKLKNVYSPLAAYVHIALDDPLSDYCSLHKQYLCHHFLSANSLHCLGMEH